MIVAGFGFRRAATVASLRDALQRTGRGAEAQMLATVADKAQAPVFRSLARQLDRPVHAVDSALLAAQQTATHSAASLTAFGTGSVAEAAALAAAGPGAKLIGARQVSTDGMATCALAERRPR